jgi:hypothetical protein
VGSKSSHLCPLSASTGQWGVPEPKGSQRRLGRHDDIARATHVDRVGWRTSNGISSEPAPAGAASVPGVRMGRPPKLAQHQRREALRRRNNRGTETLADIARSYNVSPVTIS